MFENFILQLSFSLTSQADSLANIRGRIEANNNPSRSNTKRKRKIPIRIKHNKNIDCDIMHELDK